MFDPVSVGIARVTQALVENASSTWVLAYSGGKDSTAILKLFVAALIKQPSGFASINVVYCDTGVENVAIDRFVIGNIQ